MKNTITYKESEAAKETFIIKDLYPNLREVNMATQTFANYIDANSHITPRNVLLRCALSEVWRQGRIYQRDHVTTNDA